MQLVIDTNVLLHASNPEEPRFEAASLMVEELAEHTCCIAVDDGFDLVEARNASHIGSEYLARLVPGSAAMALLAILFSTSRVVEVPKNPGLAISRAVNPGFRSWVWPVGMDVGVDLPRRA